MLRVLLLVALLSCVASSAAAARAGTDLAGEWRVALSPVDRAEPPDARDGHWRTLKLPDPAAIAARFAPGDVFWYATEAELPAAAAPRAVAIGRVLGAFDLYVAGRRVGGQRDGVGGPRVFAIPSDLAPEGASVTVMLRVDRRDGPPAALGGGAITGGPLRLGLESELRTAVSGHVEAERRHAERNLWLAGILLMVALLQLHLFSRRLELRAYFWYGLLCAGVAGFIGSQSEVWLAFGSYRLEAATLARRLTGTLVIVSAVEFTTQFLFDRPPGWRLRSISAVAIALFLLAATLGVDNDVVTLLSDVISAVAAVVLVTLIARAAGRGHRPARIIVVGATLFAATTIITLWPPTWVRDFPLAPVTLGFPALVLSMSLALSDRFTRTLAELRATHAATRRFVPFEFLELLERETIVQIRRGDHVTMEMTVLFSDVRAFTSLAERMGPEASFGFINQYLGIMAPEITRHDGFIDKYIGDAIMALFPPERHDGADNAVRAAIASIDALAAHNRLRSEEGGEAIAVGVGIHTGPLVLGTVGDEDRLSCTVLGDSVNLAARVEALTRHYGVSILITDTTRERLADADAYRMRMVDRVVVRGKSEPVTLWEILDVLPADAIARRLAHRESFAAGVTASLAGDDATAIAAFERVVSADPDDAAARYHLSACRARLPASPAS
ncbi:MAG: adenylate/guanylate cyclase domain-containing protein [Myxococcota bacterium]